MAGFEVRQTTDGFDVETLHGKSDRPRINFDRPPLFEFTVPLRSGIERTILGIGKEVQIKRLGEVRQLGVIETLDDHQGGNTASILTLKGMHKGYKQIQRAKCDMYDYDEDDLPATTRDAVTVNPWNYYIHRKGTGAINVYGDTQAIDGVRADEIARCLIGTRFIHQHTFRDNSFLLKGAIYDPNGRVQVYVDNGSQQPALQRVRHGDYFRPGGAVESIPLENGDPNIDPMGDVSAVDVLLIGELGNTDHPTIDVCRNARAGVRTYNPVTLTRTANYLGSGKDAWTGSLTFADAPAAKNSLGYKLLIPGAGGAGTYHVGAFAREGNLWFVESVDSGVNWNFIPITTDGRDWSWSRPSNTHTVRAAIFKAVSSTEFVVVYADETDVGTGTTTRLDWRLARSVDSGATWITSLIESSYRVTGGAVYFDFAIRSTTDLHVVYSFTPTGSSAYLQKLRYAKSTNSGGSWTISDINANSFTGLAPSIQVIDASNIVVVATTANGSTTAITSYKSSDGGATWPTTATVNTDIPFGMQAPDSLVVLDSTTYMYAYGSTTSNFATRHIKVAKTTDSGATWISTTVSSKASSSGFFTTPVAYAISATNIIFVVNCSGDPSTGGYKFFRTTNGGSTYSALTLMANPDPSTGEPTDVNQYLTLIAESATSYLFYRSAYTEFRSTNSGSTWTKRAVFTPIMQSGGSSQKLQGTFANIVVTPEAQTTATTRIDYIKLTATTASDVGLSEGTIETYAPPDLVGLDANEKKWIEVDLATLENRMFAVERVRKLTRSSSTANSSPHCDAWIDSNLAFHFKERRGADITRTYSFANQNLEILDHESYGGEIAYQTIAYGAGSGAAQTRIVSKAAHSSGGLYDSDRDPTIGGTPLYGKAARIMDFKDPNETSAVTLLGKAWAYHKQRRVPIENYRVRFLPETPRYFDVGDRPTFNDIKSQVSNIPLRVMELTEAWSGDDREQVTCDLGEREVDVEDFIAVQDTALQVVASRKATRTISTGTGNDGIYFDASNYGVVSFLIPDGSKAVGCKVRVTTIPYQTVGKPSTSTAPQPVTNESRTTYAAGRKLDTSVTPFASKLRVLEPKVGVYGGVALEFTIVNQTGSSQSYNWVLERVRGNSADIIDFGTLNVTDAQSSKVVRQVTSSSPTFPDVADYVRLRITNGVLGTADTRSSLGSIKFKVTSLTDNSYPPTTGIFTFDGDNGNGQGTPVYAQGIRCAMDPELSGAGVPVNFKGDAHPTLMGNPAASQTYVWDMHGWLAQDANGIITSGTHRIYLKSSSGNNNGAGLARAQVTIRLEVED